MLGKKGARMKTLGEVEPLDVHDLKQSYEHVILHKMTLMDLSHYNF